MPDADLPASVAEPKKRNPLITLVLVACGLIVAVLGLVKMTRGLNEMFGSSISEEVKQLVMASDEAIATATEHLQAAAPLFQAVDDAFQSQPLDAVRAEQQAAGDEAREHFAQASDQFRLAAKKLDEALAHEMVAKLKTYLSEKSRSYALRAQVCDENEQIIGLILDDSMATSEELGAKLTAAIERRDAAEKEAGEIEAKAEAAVKQD